MTQLTDVALPSGIRLAHTDTGSGPTLLFHQGFSLTQQIWEPLVSELTADFRCVTFDPRGHGASDAPESGYSIDHLAVDLAGLVAALNLTEVTLVGHSMGGAASLIAAADQDADGPISRLVLLGPSAPGFVQREGQPYGAPAAVFSELRRGMDADFAANARRSADMFFHQTDPEHARRIFEATLAMRQDVASALFADLEHLDLETDLSEVAVPVLALWGEHDNLADPRWAEWFRAKNLRNWQIDTLAHSGHGSMVDEPVEIARRIREFVGVRA
ncbi:non-heme chloroperoxidase [Rhodococcus qingshengii]|uniref:alpha/beta fold hydrolase n=1 Tax=Rhodococcus qingshengii TaxID=334542 RepID=UPI0007E56BF6|nr:alpha/beta hydrolase [Rhodococcus qingshengii]BCF83307.1 non-heme chloroperoxidase [Rhodococcus qingshengii]